MTASATFQYRSDQIRDIVAAEKCLRNPGAVPPDQPLPFKHYGQNSRLLMLNIDLVDGPLLNLRFIVKAGVLQDTSTFDAALLLDDQRIRGIGYALVETKRWYKIRIPKGWHQNIINPDRTGDANQHEALPDFDPTDLNEFFHLSAQKWNIKIPRGGQLF